MHEIYNPAADELYESYVSWASQHCDWVFPVLMEMLQELRTQILYNGLPSF
jgi:hypothetical protein